MDWLALITTIIGAITGGGLMFLLNPKAAKKKPELENMASEAGVKQTESNTYNEAMKSMQETILSQEERNRELFEENAKCHKDLLEAQSDLMLCSTAICRWALCPLREPTRGLGDELIKECKAKKESIFDSLEFEEFAKQKGYIVQKINN